MSDPYTREIYTRKITKEQYDRAQEHHGMLAREDRVDVFTESERCGYGVSWPMTYEDDGEYYVRFELGSSCD